MLRSVWFFYGLVTRREYRCMEILSKVLGFISIVVGAQYVFGPILVYINQRTPSRHKFNIIDKDEFLLGRGDVFRELHKEIVGSGFRYVGSSDMKMSHSSTYFSIYYSEVRYITCTLLTAEAKNIPTTTQIEFTKIYSDSSTVSINNNSIFNVYPKWELKEGYRFPEINNFVGLLEVAERIMSARKPGRAPLPLIQEEEFKTIEDHLNLELDRLIDLGWISSKVVDGKRGLTIKGAIIMTWKLCWPVKSALNKIDLTRSRRVLSGA